MSNKKLTHIDEQGNPSMVDISEKPVTKRMATARARVRIGAELIQLIKDQEIFTKKGPVFQTAIVAGIMGAKKTSELIPLCHPLGLDNCKINIQSEMDYVIIECTTALSAKTGVEMEALTGASVAALTVYDMCKAYSNNIIIEEIMLMEKTGGKEDFKRVK